MKHTNTMKKSEIFLCVSIVTFFILLPFVGLYPTCNNFSSIVYTSLKQTLFADVLLFIVSLITLLNTK